MAKYTMQEMNDLNNEGKTLLYPRLINSGSRGTDELASYIAECTSFSTADVKGVLDQLARGIALALARGESVKLDGIGLFTATLGLRKGKAREEPDGGGSRRNASNIEINNVAFRADKKLVRMTNEHCRLERVSGKFPRRVSRYSAEERLALALDFLARHPYMRVVDYAVMTGLSRTVAGCELRRLYQMPGSGIGISGMGAHRVYVRVKPIEEA